MISKFRGRRCATGCGRRGSGCPALNASAFSNLGIAASMLVSWSKSTAQSIAGSRIVQRSARYWCSSTTHAALRRDVGLATLAAERLFPPLEADLIRNLVQLDLPFYDTSLSEYTVQNLNAFAFDMGLLKQPVPFDKVVATSMSGAAKHDVVQTVKLPRG
jgi:hypothetical protein